MNVNNRTSVRRLSDRELLTTRVFDAPRKLVFRAHTDPALVPLWWGPRSTTTIVDQMDVRPGGAWRFIHRNADGSEDGFRGEFREISPYERLVWTFEYEGWAGHVVLEAMTFAEQDGKTTLTVLSTYDTPEDCEAMIASGMEDGMRETYERLDDLLAQQTAAAG